MIPKKYGPILFSFLLSGLMSLLVSGITTFRAVGVPDDMMVLWTSAWLTAWPAAFPAVMLAAPLTRRIVRSLVAES